MGKYTVEQRHKIVEIYRKHKSFAKTREICRQLFGEKMVPNYITIKRYLEQLEELGHLNDLKPQHTWVCIKEPIVGQMIKDQHESEKVKNI
ncbi:hypothetical protein BLA29_002312 [Euroglyphus maynei]|uniref:DUF4817 domain-containing protein n=1 Tax=Euroglyphus maynei TaxID=6958 RepID=A0A1Y3BFG8_EURMA|nr:hypothetical protein BLA29_002312 [Euroglyphus maynei]